MLQKGLPRGVVIERTPDGAHIDVASPYNTRFVAWCKANHGRWDRVRKLWVFEAGGFPPEHDRSMDRLIADAAREHIAHDVRCGDCGHPFWAPTLIHYERLHVRGDFCQTCRDRLEFELDVFEGKAERLPWSAEDETALDLLFRG